MQVGQAILVPDRIIIHKTTIFFIAIPLKKYLSKIHIIIDDSIIYFQIAILNNKVNRLHRKLRHSIRRNGFVIDH